MDQGRGVLTCPARARADCPIKGSGLAGFLVAPSMLLDPAPPVPVTAPPESFPSAPIGTATTELACSFVKKNIALFVSGPQGCDEALGIRYAASSRIWETVNSILMQRVTMSL